MSAKYTFWAWAIKLQKAPLKLTLLKLADNANDDGVSWYSVPKMAEHCGMSDRAFQGHLKTLVDMGLLKINERPGTSCVYHLQYHEAHLIATQNLHHTPADISGVPPQNLHHTPAESADDPNNEPNNGSVNGTSACADRSQPPREVFLMMANRFMELIPEMGEIDTSAQARGRMTKAVNFYKRFKFTPQRWDAYLMAIKQCDWMMTDRPRGDGTVWKRKSFDFLITEKCYLAVREGRYTASAT